MILSEIKLEDLRFYAHHGIYEQERMVGGEFAVDLSVKKPIDDDMEDDLSATISYADLYDIAAEVMQQHRALIESVALEILKRCREKFETLTQIDVTVSKVSPPISGMCGSAYVKMHWEK